MSSILSGKMRLLVHLKLIGIYTVYYEILENASNKKYLEVLFLLLEYSLIKTQQSLGHSIMFLNSHHTTNILS